MKLKLLAGCALACLALAACGTTGQTVLNNVNNSCDRDYKGTISSGLGGLFSSNFTGSVDISCHAADGKGAGLPTAPPGDPSQVPKP